MHLSTSLLALSVAASSVLAAPFASFLSARAAVYPSEAQDSAWKIHESCNGTQRAQIQSAIGEMNLLANTAISHILDNPTDEELFTKYFGADADPAPILGYYLELLSGNKGNALLRCDDPDGNCCAFPTEWAGHWRGKNATSETVICDRSYLTRRPLSQLCALGFSLANDNPSIYFGVDLMHRAFHVPEFVHGKVEHFADSYEVCVELAGSTAEKGKKEDAGKNQHSLQYFALEVYSRTTTKWGCVGEFKHDHDGAKGGHGSGASSSSASANAGASTTTTAGQATSQTAKASTECHSHPHPDGSVHCGTH